MEGFTIKKTTPFGNALYYYMPDGNVFYSIKKGPLIYETTISTFEYKTLYDEYCKETRKNAIARIEKSRITQEKRKQEKQQRKQELAQKQQEQM